MGDANDEARPSSHTAAAIGAALVAATVFEALTVTETQDKTVWAATPWKADPYHTALCLAQLAVPVLILAIALRLPAWRAPGGRDRAHQTVRAAGATTALIGLTLACEWAAVAVGANASAKWTWAPIAGLVAATVLTATATVLLVRCRRRRGASARWEHDWLGDIVHLCRRIPVLHAWATPRAAAWVRRRAMTVFVTASLLGGAAVAGGQAIGEGLTDPLLIAWFLIAEASFNFAVCVTANAAAGFITRPPRTRRRRIAETSAVAGCVALVLAVAFHAALWSVLGSGPLTAGALQALTLGAGLATTLATASALATRGRGPSRRDDDGATAA